MKAITPQFPAVSNLFHNIVSKAWYEKYFCNLYEAIMYLSQIVTLRGCEKTMGDQRSTKYDASTVAPTVGEKAHLETK